MKFCNTPFGPQSVSISGNVFKDANTDYVFDASETGIPNISVWFQKINADSTIDPQKTFATTDALGNYKFTPIKNGKYQVHVDIADANLPAGNIIGGVNPLVITVTDSNIINVDFPFDEVVCTTFSGEISEAALISPAQLTGTDSIIVPSTSITPNEKKGHLRAYELDANGVPKTKAKWDADKKMTTGVRSWRIMNDIDE